MSQVKILNDRLLPEITDIIMDYNLPEKKQNDFKNQILFCFGYANSEIRLRSENRTEAKYFDLLRIIRERVRKIDYNYSNCINFFKYAELNRKGVYIYTNKICNYIKEKITEKEKKLLIDLSKHI